MLFVEFVWRAITLRRCWGAAEQHQKYASSTDQTDRQGSDGWRRQCLGLNREVSEICLGCQSKYQSESELRGKLYLQTLNNFVISQEMIIASSGFEISDGFLVDIKSSALKRELIY